MEPYYQDDDCTIYNGDCREILEGLRGQSIGSVITDPPFSINTKSDGLGKLNPWADICNASMFYEWWLREARRLIAFDGCLWSHLSWRTLPTFQKASCDLQWPIESLLVWDKGSIGPGGSRGLRPRYELVALFAGIDFGTEDRGLPDIQRFQWAGAKPLHPAQKPLPLARWLMETTVDGQLILDPFMGSGTTLRAAKDLGRKAIGIELDERYCEIAAKRLQQAVLPLFGG